MLRCMMIGGLFEEFDRFALPTARIMIDLYKSLNENDPTWFPKTPLHGVKYSCYTRHTITAKVVNGSVEASSRRG